MYGLSSSRSGVSLRLCISDLDVSCPWGIFLLLHNTSDRVLKPCRGIFKKGPTGWIVHQEVAGAFLERFCNVFIFLNVIYKSIFAHRIYVSWSSVHCSSIVGGTWNLWCPEGFDVVGTEKDIELALPEMKRKHSYKKVHVRLSVRVMSRCQNICQCLNANCDGKGFSLLLITGGFTPFPL